MTVLEILDQLADTASRNEKQDILKKHKDNAVLKQVVEIALNPFVQFYIRKIPEYKTTWRNKKTLPWAIEELGVLARREETGNRAIAHLTDVLESVSEEDAKVIERIIAKDLRCGVSESTANKIWKDLVPSYPCMLASGFEQKLLDKMTWPAIAQIKLDGMRFNAIVKNGSVTFRSRNGKELAINSPLLIKSFTDMATNIGMTEVVFDGELLVADETGNYLDRQTGNGILNKAGKGTISDDESAQVRAIVWDLIPVIHFEAGKCPVPYAERLETLSIAVNNLGYNLEHLVAVVETTYVTDRNQAQKVFDQYYAEGQEGIILKSASGIWEDKRAKHQIKYKGELECDLKVVGVEEGTGKYRGMLGAIICESADGVVKVSVGSGFNDAQRKEGVPVGSIVAVKYNQRIKNVSGDESLFLPIFIELRSDKDKADKSKDIK
jgi:ATP-dependent DNA ligase